MFEKAKCIENIKSLAKIRNIKIGDLEDEIKASKGYLSRLSNDDISNLPLDKLAQIAEKLNVSLDALVYGDIAGLNAKELSMFDFIHKLTVMTEKNKLDWRRKSMYVVDTNTEYGWSTNDMFKNNLFVSKFVDAFVVNKDVCYVANLPRSSKKLVLFSINFPSCEFDDSEATDLDDSERIDTYELYMIDSYDNYDPVCSSELTVETLKNQIKELGNQVFGARSKIGLTDTVKSEIESFMDNVDEEGNLIYTDDHGNRIDEKDIYPFK